MTPRYYLNSNSNIKIWTNNISYITVYSSKTKPIFVDLLESTEEGSCNHIKIRAFFNNGEIIIGHVVGCMISIFNIDSLYDGRFNSDKY